MNPYGGRKHVEAVDHTPVALPLNYTKPESLTDLIARVIRAESHRASQQGLETVEEADDFDVEEDHDHIGPFSRYQLTDMQEEMPLRKEEKRGSGQPQGNNGDVGSGQPTPAKSAEAPAKPAEPAAKSNEAQ